jgi:hypothetical protein
MSAPGRRHTSCGTGTVILRAEGIEDMTRERHAHDLGCPFRDHVTSLISPQPLHRQIRRKTDATMHLKAHVSGLSCHLGTGEFNEKGVISIVLAAVELRGRPIDQ